MHFTAATLLFIAAGATAMGDDVCLPGGFKGGLTNAGCLDKGCWGMNSERYGDLPVGKEKYISKYIIPKCTPKVPQHMCSVCPLNWDNVVDPNVETPLTDQCFSNSCDNEGYFKNCGRMYDLDYPGCKEALE